MKIMNVKMIFMFRGHDTVWFSVPILVSWHKAVISLISDKMSGAFARDKSFTHFSKKLFESLSRSKLAKDPPSTNHWLAIMRLAWNLKPLKLDLERQSMAVIEVLYISLRLVTLQLVCIEQICTCILYTYKDTQNIHTHIWSYLYIFISMHAKIWYDNVRAYRLPHCWLLHLTNWIHAIQNIYWRQHKSRQIQNQVMYDQRI